MTTLVKYSYTLVAPVRVWLLLSALMVVLMVGVGGYTRLTDSGLSITYWKPVHGVIPPANTEEWNEEFALYQQTPEYQQKNRGMALSEFQQIFWVEYWHRMIGRLTGIVFALPLALFWGMGYVQGRVRWHVLGILALGGLQGAFGWWMVHSGLIDRPDVSHYRLTVHLITAFIIFSWLLGLFFMSRPAEPRMLSTDAMQRLWKLHSLLLVSCGAFLLQLVLGGFTAGLDAGFSYNTYPFMDGRWYPEGAHVLQPVWLNVLENPIMIQFLHRWWAMVVLLLAIAVHMGARSLPMLPLLATSTRRILGALALQIGLGIATLLMVIPVGLGVLHQVTALLVVATLVQSVCLVRQAMVGQRALMQVEPEVRLDKSRVAGVV